MHLQNKKLLAFRFGIKSFYTLLLFLIAGVIMWASLELGLSYEHGTMLVLAYFGLELLSSVVTIYTPTTTIMVILLLPLVIITVLCFNQNHKPKPSADQIREKIIEKSHALQRCAA